MEITKQNINLLLILTPSIGLSSIRGPGLSTPAGCPCGMPLSATPGMECVCGWEEDRRAAQRPYSLLSCGEGEGLSDTSARESLSEIYSGRKPTVEPMCVSFSLDVPGEEEGKGAG